VDDPDFLNPYEPPQSDMSWAAPTVAKIKGPWLVVPRFWSSPAICFVSGETENLLPPITKKAASPSNPAIALLAIGDLLIALSGLNPWLVFAGGIIVILAVWSLRRKAAVQYFLSRHAQRRLKKRVVSAGVLFFAGSLLLFLTLDSRSAGSKIQGLGIGALFVSAVLSAKWSQPFIVRKVTAGSVWLEGIPPQVQAAIIRLEQSPEEAVAEAPPRLVRTARF